MSAVERVDLDALAALLRSRHLPIQQEIADTLGIEQSLVSRVKNRKVKRITPSVERLWQYANMRVGSRTMPAEINGAVKRYLADGGDPELLIRQVGLLHAAVSSNSNG